ncbi:MAG: hypothetical protein ACKOPQ_03050 [Novosphingobium sp.]
MAKTVSLQFSQDELEILVDALDADMEGYLEAAKEARMSNNREEIVTFTEAAARIQMLLERVQEHVEDEG